MAEKLYVDQIDYHRSIEKLAHIIKRSKVKFDYVYGIPTAGTPIAFFLSKALNIPQRFWIAPHSFEESWLIVDEICDTGSTFIKFVDFWAGHITYRTACLHIKDHSRYAAHFVAEPEIPKDTWVYYFYENQNTSPDEEIQNHLKKTECKK